MKQMTGTEGEGKRTAMSRPGVLRDGRCADAGQAPVGGALCCSRVVCLLLSVCLIGPCRAGAGGEGEEPALLGGSGRPKSATPTDASAAPAAVAYEVTSWWPHDRKAFTQGLVFSKGMLLESTGLNGQSSLRKVDIKTGRVLKQVNVPSEYFAEGIAVLRGKIFQLTWQSRKGFVYDLESLDLEREFSYESEGWGLTTDGRWLILSDGTERLRWIDPDTFRVARALEVFHRGRPVRHLNELEYIQGQIYANVWGADSILRIHPQTGLITGVLNCRGLLGKADRAGTDVLNGIAYDPEQNRVFITGKLWPKVFEVKLAATP
ncbi:MAG: glutaminyl-peptide cyclotransferase [Verrucomicrobiota bacterium]